MLPNVKLQFRHKQHLEETTIPQGMNDSWKGDALKPLDDGPDIIYAVFLPRTVAGIVIVEIDDQSLVDLICIDVNRSRAICVRASAAAHAALLCRLMIPFAGQIGAESAFGASCDFVVFKKHGCGELNHGCLCRPQHRSREPHLILQLSGRPGRETFWGTFGQGCDALSEAATVWA
jgi:hypothetical protein